MALWSDISVEAPHLHEAVDTAFRSSAADEIRHNRIVNADSLECSLDVPASEIGNLFLTVSSR